MGKACVAHLKAMTTPRMECMAAVVSLKVTNMLSRELNFDTTKEFHYTDSTVVLGYINNEARRLHTYVGNRIQHILDKSDLKQWWHFTGELNPADKASCRLTTVELLQNHHWLNCPNFLWRNTEQLPNAQPTLQLDPDDRKVKREVATTLTIKQVNLPKVFKAAQFEHFSSFDGLKQSLILIQSTQLATVKELKDTKRFILKSVEYKHFPGEVKCLEKLSKNKDTYWDRMFAEKKSLDLKSIG